MLFRLTEQQQISLTAVINDVVQLRTAEAKEHIKSKFLNRLTKQVDDRCL